MCHTRSPYFGSHIAEKDCIAGNAKLTCCLQHYKSFRIAILERYQQCVRRISERVGQIPQGIDADISPFSQENGEQLVENLILAEDDIVEEIKQIISRQSQVLPTDSEESYDIGNSGGPLLILTLERPSLSTILPLEGNKLFGGEYIEPIFYKGTEYRTFRNKILDKLGQLREGELNVLMIYTTRISDDSRNLLEAIKELSRKVEANDNEFFKNIRTKRGSIRNIKDFLELWQRVSCTIYLDEFQGFQILYNANAELKIPSILREYFLRIPQIISRNSHEFGKRFPFGFTN